MSDLTRFLLARIAEDETEAREAIEERTLAVRPELDVPDYELKMWPDVGTPAVLVGPERVLAECEAKRQLIERFRRMQRDEAYGTDPTDGLWQLLALPYATHSDYRQEWNP